MDETPESVEGYGDCPVCGKALVRKKSRFGTYFYGCPGYPDCKFLSKDIVVKGKCPDCGGYIVLKKLKSGQFHCCSNKDCQHKIKIGEPN